MVRARRGVFAVLALCVLVGAAVAGTVLFLRLRLPDPEHSNRQQLVRWLVERDVGREPAELRCRLMRRLEEEFAGGFDWEAAKSRLTENQRRRVWKNFVLILEPWFADKIEAYYRLAAEQRPAMLDRLVDELSQWRHAEGIQCEGPDAAEGQAPDQGKGLTAALVAQLERRKAEAEPAERERLSQFLAALQWRWLIRGLPGMQ